MRWLVLAALLAACGSHDDSSPPPEPPQRRVIEPPPDDVRERPPHAIRADGVGPYKLGLPLDGVRRPSGVPRNAEYDIPGVVHASVTRTDDTIFVGGEPRGLISFVAVVGGDVARTETGSVHVGSPVDELDKALGPRLVEPEVARDPHVVVPSKLPNLRAVLSGDAISALVVRGDVDVKAASTQPPVDAIAGSPECPRPAPVGTSFGACLATGELVSVEGDDLSVRMPDVERPIAIAHVTGLVFAAPVRTGEHDDLVVIARADDAARRAWSLVAFRMENGKLVRTVESEPLYQLTPTSTRWIGSELRDVELYLEVTGKPESYEVGGLLVTRPPRVRDVLVLTPISVARKRGKSAIGEATDAGVPSH